MPQTIKIKYAQFICAFILFIALSIPENMQAQGARKIERSGDAAFAGKAYYSAAKFYSAILYDSPLVQPSSLLVYPFQPVSHGRVGQVKKSRRNEVVYKLAESYRLYNHFKEALVQYERYLSSQDKRFPLAGLWYGLCLLAHDQPQKSITALTNFLQTYITRDIYTEKARQGIASANFVIASRLLQPGAVITKLQTTVSGDGSDFALEKMNDSIFWFTSSRHELDNKKERIYPVRLYEGNLYNHTAGKIAGFPADLNMATPSLSSDGLTMYFTGWKEDAKKKVTNYQIFYMSRTAEKLPWTSPVALPAPVNITGFHSKQPFITRDNNYLLFSSDQPGSLGKFDIWMVAMNGKDPMGKAFNLGSGINTAADEVTPFYDADSSRLYFSSDGRVGMGGLDIYQATGSPAHNEWNRVTNLGLPLNSVRDDEYYRQEQHSGTAYLSSDRASLCCLEIFKVVKIKYTDTLQKDTTHRKLSADNSLRQISSIADGERMNKQLLDSINAVAVVRNEVHYHFASANIRYADRARLNEIVRTLTKNPALNIVIASFTDCIGSRAANILLARKRSESVKAYLVRKGVDTSRINIDFFGKKHFILPCREDRTYNRQEQIANRRSDLILTKEKKPIWRPSGRELDIDPSLFPLNRSVHITSEQQLKTSDKSEENAVHNHNQKQNDTTVRTHSRYNRSVKNKKQGNKNLSAAIEISQADLSLRGKSTPITEKPLFRRDTGVMHKLPVNTLLDLLPRVKSGVIAEMTKRIPRKPLVLYSTSDSVRIDLYDNGVFDYDTVSVIYNKQLVSYKELLQTNKPISFYVKLNVDPAKNEMILFAENLGLTPPNSALMVITDGENKRTEVNVASDLAHNTVIYFIKVKKEKQ